jgi:pimeloyl-ACP methyl ester carboxylesterase
MAQEDEVGLWDWSSLDVDLVRYDAPGHGTAPAPLDDDAYRWAVLAATMLGQTDGRFVAGGASMGCATSLWAAVQAPERVEALLLVIPPTAWATRAGQGDLYRAAAHVIETRGLAQYLELAAQVPPQGVPAEDARLREIGARHTAKMSEAALPHVLRGAAASDLPDPAAIEQLTQPALILAWAGDPGHPESTAEQLRDLLPHSELHVADHLPALSAWPELAAAWLAHLS